MTEFTLQKDFKQTLLGANQATSALSLKLVDAMIEKAADLIDQDALCAVHKGQPLVAFDERANSFHCAQCIYDGSVETPQFITLKARETYDNFNKNYS